MLHVIYSTLQYNAVYCYIILKRSVVSTRDLFPIWGTLHFVVCLYSMRCLNSIRPLYTTSATTRVLFSTIKFHCCCRRDQIHLEFALLASSIFPISYYRRRLPSSPNSSSIIIINQKENKHISIIFSSSKLVRRKSSTSLFESIITCYYCRVGVIACAFSYQDT
jgi:hypothetical protein